MKNFIERILVKRALLPGTPGAFKSNDTDGN